MTIEKIKENLERYYRTIEIANTEWDFFIFATDYVQYIVETPTIDKIAMNFIKERRDDEKKLKKYEQKVILEIKKAFVKLKKILKARKISYNELDRWLSEFKKWEEGKIVASASNARNLNDAFRDILRSLFEIPEYRKIISDFVIESKEIPNNIEKFIFSPSISQLAIEEEIFTRKEKIKLWGSWNNLALLYITIVKGREHWEQLKKESGVHGEKNLRKFYEAFNFIGVLGELQEIIDGKYENKNRIQFEKNKYRQYIVRVHNYFMKELSKIEKNSKLKKSKGNSLDILKQADKPIALISKNTNGDYLYKGIYIIEISKDTIYYNVFDILYSNCDQDGFLSYENIEKQLIERDYSETKNDQERNKRINNAITNTTQGFFRYAKINNNKLINKTPSGKKLIKVIRGKGLQLNNPCISVET